MRTAITLLSACVTASVGSATLLLPWTATAAVSTIEVVIASGDPLPGGGVFQASDVPVINDAGQIVFSADDLISQSSFRWDPAPPQFLRIVGPGSTVPGGPGVVYSAFVGALNDAGESAFSAELVGFPADSPRMYRSNGAALVEIVRETAAAPGGNGTITSFSPGILNHAGEVAFIGYLSGTSGGGADAEALYRGDGATLLQVVRRGEPAPGGNGSFASFSVPALNTQGELGFQAYLIGASGGSNWGFFRADGTPGGIVPIARRGQTAPGGGAVLDVFNTTTPSLNESGQLAFVAGLVNSVGGAVIGQAVYVGDGGVLTEVARSGNVAPGGGTLGSSLTSPLVNGAGQVVFAATLSGGGQGIFRRDGEGALIPIVRTGQLAPDGDGTFQSLEGFAFNDAGQVAFRAYFTGGSGPEDDHRLFLYDDYGLVQLLRTGDPLLGSTLLELNLATQGAQHLAARRPLNDHGEVAFSFVLDDFRNGLAVPEPATGQLIAPLVGLYGAARLRRRRSCLARDDSFAMASST